jgi:transposase
VLLLPRAVRVLLAAEPVDMRNSIDGLVTVVRSGWKEDVFAGHLFVFISRRRDRAKILTWDQGGFVLYYKRLEQGRFRLPAFQDDALGAQLDATQLSMLLDGIDLSHVRRPKKWTPSTAQGDRQVPLDLISTTRWPSAKRIRATTASGAKKPKRSRARTSSSGRRSRS